ncbi:hypothetical protein GT043_02285 [Streptomyces sp. SID2131]|nr:hypothetical protein [Streptomyces sp. SID2131]
MRTDTAYDTQLQAYPHRLAGPGQGIYDQIEATSNFAGEAAGDLVTRDLADVLWQHLGKGDSTFAPRTGVGGGWNTYWHLGGTRGAHLYHASGI